jgi:hypothetical protein
MVDYRNQSGKNSKKVELWHADRPISAGSFIRLGSRTIQHHHNVFGLGRKHQKHTRQCWMKSHTVNMGQGAQRAPCRKKTKRTDPDPTLSFHQHVPMTCWTITICPRSCSTGKIYVASAHVPPNCRVLCRKQLGEKAHLQNRKRFERVHIIYLIGFLLSIFEASIDHLNYQTHRLIKPEVSTIQPSYPHHIPMKRLVLYGFILKSPLIYQSSWEFHKSYKSPIHKSYKSFNEFRMFRIIVPPNPPQKNGGLSKFYSHEK